MLYLNDFIKSKLAEISLKEFPNEAGALLVEKYNTVQFCEVKNVSVIPKEHFLIDKNEQIEITQQGKILAFCHSHSELDGLSQADIVIAEKQKINMIVFCVKTKNYFEYVPQGFEMPYIGRKYYFKVLDCLTLVMDYYQREFNITIAYIESPLVQKGFSQVVGLAANQENLGIGTSYLESQGFYRVQNLKKHDVLVIIPKESRFPCHLGIYLGEDRFLHQLEDESTIAHYSNFWKNRTKFIFRHKDVV